MPPRSSSVSPIPKNPKRRSSSGGPRARTKKKSVKKQKSFTGSESRGSLEEALSSDLFEKAPSMPSIKRNSYFRASTPSSSSGDSNVAKRAAAAKAKLADPVLPRKANPAWGAQAKKRLSRASKERSSAEGPVAERSVSRTPTPPPAGNSVVLSKKKILVKGKVEVPGEENKTPSMLNGKGIVFEDQQKRSASNDSFSPRQKKIAVSSIVRKPNEASGAPQKLQISRGKILNIKPDKVRVLQKGPGPLRKSSPSHTPVHGEDGLPAAKDVNKSVIVQRRVEPLHAQKAPKLNVEASPQKKEPLRVKEKNLFLRLRREESKHDRNDSQSASPVGGSVPANPIAVQEENLSNSEPSSS